MSQTITTPIGQLRPHPAQMRTIYDLEPLAALTLQLYQRGLDSWSPIVVSRNGESSHIVSGHRRHMALLLSYALHDWAAGREADHPETNRCEASAITIEVTRTMVETLVERLGSLEKVVESLQTKYGEREITAVLFEGSQKAEILTLQAANYGSEKPDMLGVAHSFRQALEAGATVEEIARNSGQHKAYVENHLALTQIPPELAQRIAAGDFPMSVGITVADLPEPKRTGLAVFVLANEPGKVTAKAVKECAATLKRWPGLQMPLMAKHQAQRNVARALVNLWAQVVETYPEDAYAAAAMLIYRNLHEEPWAAQEKLSVWFQALGGDTYFADGRIHWANVVAYLMPEVGCQTCPVSQLPKELLHSDLAQGQGGPLGMPCRGGEQAERCIHGLAESDPFDVRVPWDWAEHPGVVHQGGEYRVTTYADLLQAWQAQQAKEAAEAAEAVVEEAGEGEQADTVGKAGPTSPAPAATDDKPVAEEAAAADTPPAKDSPIAKQREQIATFMQRHEELAVTHPFATACASCRHRLDASPTKDPDVPHCAWAGRLRTVHFRQLKPVDGRGPVVPVCRQFAPTQPWNEIIPTHAAPPGVPRDWLKAQILLLVKAGQPGYGSSAMPFEFLTGRPLGANDSYSDWFSQQFKEQIGNLSLEQLWTLFIWATAEWQRAKKETFLLPTTGAGAQFAAYKEGPWRAGE